MSDSQLESNFVKGAELTNTLKDYALSSNVPTDISQLNGQVSDAQLPNSVPKLKNGVLESTVIPTNLAAYAPASLTTTVSGL